MKVCEKLLEDPDTLHEVAAFADTFSLKIQSIKNGDVFAMLRLTQGGKATEKTCVLAFDEFQDILVELSQLEGLTVSE